MGEILRVHERNAHMAEKCRLLVVAGQGHGKSRNRLAGLVARRGRNKARHREAAVMGQIAQIGFAVPPAALGPELKSLDRLFHREKKETTGRKPPMGGPEYRS